MAADEDRSEVESVRVTRSNAAASQREIVVRANQIDARDLFAGTREISIMHGEEMYRMRLTAQNKLILTK